MKVKRITQIENYIKEKKEASLEELKNHFDVSLNTIRRDINELAKSETVKKVYGGVVYNKKETTMAYEDRNISHLLEKRKIGTYCSKYIESDDIIFIDSGTTTHYILDDLDKNISFTLITNSLEVINKAVNFPNVTLLITGDTYKKSTKSFTGISENQTIHKFNINKAFMSATAFSIDNGASNTDLLENRTKSMVCSRSNEVYLLIDSSKFGQTSLFTYCHLEKINVIVTDNNIDRDYLDELNESITEVIAL
ncbi:DeoR/GlpR family DNA-binding transcription regulator [Salinicoccus roseus]|uniref:DeoR/GlpR family DNA-binding transcription regulator n=1 Tax=Salinicoccus roseus TaxID=45670 RepID=UPI001CA7B3DE|nr:DeoR/GlpR family DNA-binding transcription regulator [Salinicoccus roseus]MBY8909182.1 DeoR/GlpR family DNA-binding transcription regulator [Salinicoccus roseus]